MLNTLVIVLNQLHIKGFHFGFFLIATSPTVTGFDFNSKNPTYIYEYTYRAWTFILISHLDDVLIKTSHSW